MKKIYEKISNNMVTFIFIILCIGGMIFSKQPLSFIFAELVRRIGRNAFLVLSLIIPVICGMGLNFGIVIGAMAGQISIIMVTNWILKGAALASPLGLIVTFAISTPFAILFGLLTGMLLNKTKGQEMIASMMLGFFANGLYQLLFLFLVGTIIPVNNPVIIMANGVGVKNTLDLSNGLKYTLDNIVSMGFFAFIIALSALAILYSIYRYVKNENEKFQRKYIHHIIIYLVVIVLAIVIIDPLGLLNGTSSSFIKQLNMISKIKIPLITLLVILCLCLFNILIVKTKAGQDFRSVGQDMHIAEVSGIKVNKVRIKAIIISTVLAAWGQIIFLQNLGTLNTYGSHEQIAMFSIAALLIGGATVSKATVSQALLGTILFHTLFIVSPQAGKNLFGDAQIGEHFRVFIAYGVIGLSLGLHAWKQHSMQKKALAE